MKAKQKNIIIITVVLLLLVGTVVFALTRQRDDFENTNQANLPSIYYFTADWCQPCKEFRPVMEGVRDDYRGKVNIKFIDVDSPVGTSIALSYNITNVPTLIFLDKSENFLDRKVGVVSRTTIDNLIKSLGWV